MIGVHYTIQCDYRSTAKGEDPRGCAASGLVNAPDDTDGSVQDAAARFRALGWHVEPGKCLCPYHAHLRERVGENR